MGPGVAPSTLWNPTPACGVALSCVYTGRGVSLPSLNLLCMSNHLPVAGLSGEVMAKFVCKSQQGHVPLVK